MSNQLHPVSVWAADPANHKVCNLKGLAALGRFAGTYPAPTGMPASEILTDLPSPGSIVIAKLSAGSVLEASAFDPSEVECRMADTGTPSKLIAGVYGPLAIASGPFGKVCSSNAPPKLARRMDGVRLGGGSPESKLPLGPRLEIG